jgi:hypothetical protein
MIPLEVFVIETPNSMRGRKLFSDLAGDDRIRVHHVPATMISSREQMRASPIEINEKIFHALTGRHLLFPEMGCAHSHNVVRQKVASLKFGGVILEDDARIPNLHEFRKAAVTFLSAFQNESALLNLFHGANSPRKNVATRENSHVGLLGMSKLAVAYALTPLAAQALVTSNSPIHYVSDWPVAPVKHYCLAIPVVLHGDRLTRSTIDPKNVAKRTRRNLLLALSKWSLVDYFFRARQDVSFSLYFKYNILEKVRHHLDALRLSLR